MNTQDKLQRIKAKCEEMISAFPPCESVAGWQSTVVAIDWLTPEAKLAPLASAAVARQTLEDIIAAWPEELL